MFPASLHKWKLRFDLNSNLAFSIKLSTHFKWAFAHLQGKFSTKGVTCMSQDTKCVWQNQNVLHCNENRLLSDNVDYQLPNTTQIFPMKEVMCSITPQTEKNWLYSGMFHRQTANIIKKYIITIIKCKYTYVIIIQTKLLDIYVNFNLIIKAATPAVKNSGIHLWSHALRPGLINKW